MSRAINLTLAEAEVRAVCLKNGVSISSIEPLPASGTHLVCTTGQGADEIRLRLKDHIIAMPVKRYAFFHTGSA